MKQSRRRHGRRWLAWRRLMAMRKTKRRAQRAAARAARAAARAERRRRGLPVFLVIAGLVIVSSAISWFRSRTSSVSARVYVTDSSDRIHRSLTVPTPFEPMVSMAEPAWVVVAAQDRAAAHAAMAARIAEFTNRAPLGVPARVAVAIWPDFGPVYSHLDPPKRKAMERLFQRLERANAWDPGLSAQLGGFGREALFCAAQELETLTLNDERSLRSGRMLQRLLEESTGFQAIQIVDDPALEPALRLRANADVGRLWRWFLNEVALTQKTWDVYCDLRGG